MKALTCLEEKRIAARRHRGGIQAQHRASLKAAARELVTRHEHSPIERAELRVAAGAALLVVLAEHEAMEHHVPRARREMARRKRHCIWNPCGARSHAVHRDTERLRYHGHLHGGVGHGGMLCREPTGERDVKENAERGAESGPPAAEHRSEHRIPS